MIYKERSKRRKKAFFPLVFTVTAALCLLAVTAWFDVGFKWAIELGIVLLAVGVIYYILRSGYMEYTYSIVGDTLVFKQNMGKGERYVLAVEMSNLLRLVPKDGIDSEVKAIGARSVGRYYISATELPVWGLVYYDDTYKCEKILTFKPSEQLLEILSKKTIDNRG